MTAEKVNSARIESSKCFSVEIARFVIDFTGSCDSLVGKLRGNQVFQGMADRFEAGDAGSW